MKTPACFNLAATTLTVPTTLHLMTDQECYEIVDKNLRGYQIDRLHQVARTEKSLMQAVVSLAPCLDNVPMDGYGACCFIRAIRHARSL